MISAVDPLTDARWPRLLSQYAGTTSVFHSREWLKALQQTYGYEPLALIASPASDCESESGIVFCRIKSWLTGRRMVGLPFSDHCEPLVTSCRQLGCLLSYVGREAKAEAFEYVELRPLDSDFVAQSGLTQISTYCLHKLDLTGDAAAIFRRFHKDCIQRKIRRAEREGLIYDEGRSRENLTKFYRLQIMTRRRQHLAPQPFAWFQNLAACMGENFKLSVASKGETPVAAIITLRHDKTLVYKYGCSDKRFSNLGGTPFLFWRAIQDAKRDGLLQLDLGRSDWEDEGLIRFKERLGGIRSRLTYWRYPVCSPGSGKPWMAGPARYIFSRLSDGVLAAAGNLLYKHLG